MGRRHSATVIIWTLAHYRVTTVWLCVEDDHTMLMKFIVEDCGLEGLCPQLFYCLVQKVLTMFLEVLIKIRRGRDKKVISLSRLAARRFEVNVNQK